MSGLCFPLFVVNVTSFVGAHPVHIAFLAHLIAIGKLALDVFSTMDSCHLEIPSYGSALRSLFPGRQEMSSFSFTSSYFSATKVEVSFFFFFFEDS